MTTECQPCYRQEKNEAAVNWCVQCQESLCQDCSDYHKVLKVTKDHSFITNDQYASVSDILSLIPPTCEFHTDEPLEYFCSTHDALCCIMCKCCEHFKCNSVERLEKLDLNKKSEDESKCSVAYANKLILSTESACENRSKNIKILDQFREEFVAKIKEKKTQIQNLLVELDLAIQHFDEDYHIKRQELQFGKQELIDMLEELKQRREKSVALSKLRNVGSSHFFVAEMRIRDQIEKYNVKINKYLLDLSDIDCQFTILFKTDEQKQNIQLVHDVSFSSLPFNIFADETLDRDSSTIEAEQDLLTAKNGKPENESSNMTDSLLSLKESKSDTETNQSSSPLVSGTVNEIKLETPLYLRTKFKSETDIPTAIYSQIKKQEANRPVVTEKKSQFRFKYKFHFQVEKKTSNTAIRCVQLLPKGQIIIGESSNPRLLIYEKEGYRKGEMQLHFSAESIAVIDDMNIAVTLGQSVLIVDVDNYNSMKTVRKISLSDNCYGIAFVDNSLLVNCENHGLKLMTVNGTILYTHCFIRGILNICPIEEKTIVSTKKNSEIVQFYNIVSKNRSASRCQNLFGANGITRDDKGTVFVACDQSNKIYMLPFGSQTWVSALDIKSMIDYPWSIVYDTKNNELIVVNNGGKSIFIYKKE